MNSTVIYFSLEGWLQRFIHRSDPVPFGSRDRRERRGPASPPQHYGQASGLPHRCGPCFPRPAGCLRMRSCRRGSESMRGRVGACDRVGCGVRLAASPAWQRACANRDRDDDTLDRRRGRNDVAAIPTDDRGDRVGRPVGITGSGGPVVASITGHVLAVAVDSTGRSGCRCDRVRRRRVRDSAHVDR